MRLTLSAVFKDVEVSVGRSAVKTINDATEILYAGACLTRATTRTAAWLPLADNAPAFTWLLVLAGRFHLVN